MAYILKYTHYIISAVTIFSIKLYFHWLCGLLVGYFYSLQIQFYLKEYLRYFSFLLKLFICKTTVQIRE